MKKANFLNKTKNVIKKYGFIGLALTAVLITGCEDDDDDAPEVVNEPEIFSDVKLIFTDSANNVIEARAQDLDGVGPDDMIVLDTNKLKANTTYTLTYDIWNKLTDPDTDLNAEILAEDHEHQLFYAFTTDIFTSPEGDGNRGDGSPKDPINYLDVDDNDRVVGLKTSWTTGAAKSGTFTANLQHQPDVKSDNSSSKDGATDFLLTFELIIE